MSMKTQTMWALTVSYWPRAAKAGLKPVPTDGFEQGDQFYRPTTIRFAQQPTQANFEGVVRQRPWMGVWDDLMPLITEWPTVDSGYKRNVVDVGGVGRLEIRREDLWLRS